MKDAVRRIKSGKAPGPDGVRGKVWTLAFKELGGYMRHLYNRCLREGRFPAEWKANLVLIPKGGKPADQPSAYRSICLLDEAGKILERIIANRLVRHLSRTGPDLSRDQYGFRNGRSTVDAILRVRSAVGPEVGDGGVAGYNQRLQHPAMAVDTGGVGTPWCAPISGRHGPGLS